MGKKKRGKGGKKEKYRGAYKESGARALKRARSSDLAEMQGSGYCQRDKIILDRHRDYPAHVRHFHGVSFVCCKQ